MKTDNHRPVIFWEQNKSLTGLLAFHPPQRMTEHAAQPADRVTDRRDWFASEWALHQQRAAQGVKP